MDLTQADRHAPDSGTGAGHRHRIFPRALLACLLTALPPPSIARAEPAPFDLAGPGLRVSVTHAGATLPISRVPNLSAGDRLAIGADLPADQGARYLLVAAFLRGATNPPPKNWVFSAETWKRRKNALDIIVPEGALQLVLFLVPETGGGFDAVVDAVRKQPGAFVRASQELNQASLDRARLDAFLDGIRRQERSHPERIETVSPLLTRSLGIKLKAECLDRAADLQAACLTESRDSLVLADSHSASLTETLVGAPTDLALQLSATPQGGYGYYSPYIGVVRDLAKIFGAFQSTQFQYIPALARFDDDRIALLLNAAPSFARPKSVLVAALPAIEPAEAPPLRRADSAQALCATRRDLVLPVEGAPLIYATGYAHDMVLRVAGPDGGSVDLPVAADPEKGGYVLAGNPIPASRLGSVVDATLHGAWGFTPFDGPRFRLRSPRADGWQAVTDPASLVVGRDNDFILAGAGAACVEDIALRQATGATQPVMWKAAGPDRITITLPLGRTAPGGMSLLIRQAGIADPATIALATVGAARPKAVLISKSVARPPAPSALPITIAGDDALAQDARLTFSVRAADATRFSGRESIEIATADGSASMLATSGRGLTVQSDRIAVASVEPGKALGASAYGPLRYRVVQNGIAGDWAPLVTLVRLPVLTGLTCTAPAELCTLAGSDLFLIAAVADNPAFANAFALPEGFTAPTLTLPKPAGGKLFLRLRDGRDMVATASLP